MNDSESLESLQHLIDPNLAEPVAMGGRRPRRYTLAWVLTAVLLVVGIFPVYFLSLRLIARNKESLSTQQQVNQLQLASSLAHHVDSHLQSQIRVVDVLQQLLSEQANQQRPDLLRSRLARQHTLSGMVDGHIALLRYTHRDGDWVSAQQEGFQLGEDEETALSEAFADQINVGTAGEVKIGTPFFHEGLQGPAVLLSAPISAGSRRIGVLSALCSFASLWQEAEKSAYSLYALTGEGELFTGSEPRGVMAGVPLKELEIVKVFLSTGGNRVMPYKIPGNSGEPLQLLGSYVQTHHGWGIFVEAEANLAYSFIALMQTETWSYAAVVAVGAMLLGLLSARWISHPIKSLADSSQAFAEGDFHSRVRVGSRNEVGELAETFNAMAETLEKYIARLKRAAVENSELFFGSVRALAAAIDEKDAYTRGHSERVRVYAMTLARCLGLPPVEIWKVEIGALLHDVGKIGIEDCILNKPGPLTADEYEVMKTHPVRGANIMSPIRQLREVIPGMKHHHERWDGAGYPDGLEGDAIPLAARIITVADCWDAMTTNRPYQRAMDMDEAIAMVEKLSTKVFDPEVARAFVVALRQGECERTYREARQQVEATAARVDAIQAKKVAEADRTDSLDPDCLPPGA